MLFLCTHNAGRSQMALGFFTALAGDQAVAWSGGSEPGHEVNPAAIAAMAERGIDISDEFPKPWTDETVRAADVVISMGCGDACPIFPGKRYESWDDLDDPAGLDVAAVRPIRDDIERRVRTPDRRTRPHSRHRSASGALTTPETTVRARYCAEVAKSPASQARRAESSSWPKQGDRTSLRGNDLTANSRLQS